MSRMVNLETNFFDICKEYFNCFVRTTYNKFTKSYKVEWSKDKPFIQLRGTRVYSGCFVQVLRNSITGEESVGWSKTEE